MNRLRTLLVDDERLARRELRLLLQAHPEVEVIGEAANPDEAVAAIAGERPDLVFLDIQMPGGTGFDVLERLEGATPEVVFVTAYDEFALRAFEVNALDYLLKPVEPARLAESVRRVQAVVAEGRAAAEGASAEGGAVEGSRPVEAAPPGGPLRPEDRVFVRDGERCWFVSVRDIRLLESEGNYTRLHLPDGQPLLYRSLNAMEARLPPELFFRANRAQIVNTSWVEAIDPWFSSSLRARLAGGTEVEFSRRQAQAFRERTAL